MKNLAYYKVNYIMPIYLEYAPRFMNIEKTDMKNEVIEEK